MAGMRRYAGRVRQQMSIDPSVHDAIVPTMILQPIVENAYAHGLSRLSANGVLSIDAGYEDSVLRLSVTNNGVGLHPTNHSSTGNGVGLTNVQDRLRMHYGDDQSFTITELEGNLVEVVIRLPLRFATRPTEQTTGYGV